MNLTNCEKKDNKSAQLTVVVTPEEFDAAVNEAYKKGKSHISVPGFRKGKAPRKIIEAMYGASVFYNDALDNMLPEVCSRGVADSELRTVGYPKVSDITFGDDKSATVIFDVELYPEVTLGEYRGLSAVRPAAEVEESAVDSEVASVQLRNARIQAADRPAIGGDTVVLDFEGFVDDVAFEGGKGEDYELTLGSNTFIPGFEEKLQGMTAGEERDLDLVFPEQYQEDLAGKPVVFKVKVKEVREKILPELDDEFAKDVSEFDTFAEYKNSIRERLQKARQEEADRAFEDAVLGKLAEIAQADIPESMIEEYLDNHVDNMSRQLAAYGMELGAYLNMMGTDLAGFRGNMRPSAMQQIMVNLALEKVAELEKLEPTPEEIEGYFTEMAERYNVDAAVAKQSVPQEAAARELSLRAASKLVCEAATALEPPAEDAAEDVAEEAEKPADEKPAKAKKAKEEGEPAKDAEKPAKKKPAEEKTAEKKPAEKKPAAKKPAAKKAEPESPAEDGDGAKS